jgi:Replication-relaxation
MRFGRLELFALEERLSERDRSILEHVVQLRLLRARQIQSLLFPDEQHASRATAARCCRRVLERLTRERLLVRLDRRVGGVRAGSASFIYAVSPIGHRIVQPGGVRRRVREPSLRFVDHTLAVADLLIDVTLNSREGGCDLVQWKSEPDSWCEVVTLGGTVVLRPDLFLVLAVGDYELRWFIEVDRATEHLPAITRKCRLYNTYYRSGTEQREHGVFPRTLWIAPSEQRATWLRRTITADPRLADGLFEVATPSQALAALAEGGS